MLDFGFERKKNENDDKESSDGEFKEENQVDNDFINIKFNQCFKSSTSFLSQKQYKHKVSIIFWCLKENMTDLKMADMTNILVKKCKSRIEEMYWLKGLINQ